MEREEPGEQPKGYGCAYQQERGSRIARPQIDEVTASDLSDSRDDEQRNDCERVMTVASVVDEGSSSTRRSSTCKAVRTAGCRA
jgi:hypothetical protein